MRVVGVPIQWSTDKSMSLGDRNWHQHIHRSTYPFENIKIKKGCGSGRGSIQL